MKLIKLSMPLSIVVGVNRKKSIPLNLNHYRNGHWAVLNKSKILYTDAIKNKLRNVTQQFEEVELTYVFYARNRGKVDIANVCSIHDKFFCDAIVELGIIPDDNYEHIKQISYRFGGIDPLNPRVTIYVRPIKLREKEPMKLFIDKKTMSGLVLTHINSLITLAPGTSIDLVQSEDGVEVSIVKVTSADKKVEEVKEETTKKTTTKKAETKKPTIVTPVEEVAAVEEQADDDIFSDEPAEAPVEKTTEELNGQLEDIFND